MTTTINSVLLGAACCLGLIFIICAYIKVYGLSRNHYRITGDEVRNTNDDKEHVL